MEIFRNILIFGKNHSTSVVATLLLTAFIGKGYNFIFTESPQNRYSQLNLALLSISRAILALLVAYTIHFTFIFRSRRHHTSVSQRLAAQSANINTRNVLIDIASLTTTFWVPFMLLKSILVVLAFAFPYGSALYLSLQLYHYYNRVFNEINQQAARSDSSSLITVEENAGSNNAFEAGEPIPEIPTTRTRSGNMYPNESPPSRSSPRATTPSTRRSTAAKSRTPTRRRGR